MLEGSQPSRAKSHLACSWDTLGISIYLLIRLLFLTSHSCSTASENHRCSTVNSCRFPNTFFFTDVCVPTEAKEGVKSPGVKSQSCQKQQVLLATETSLSPSSYTLRFLICFTYHLYWLTSYYHMNRNWNRYFCLVPDLKENVCSVSLK